MSVWEDKLCCVDLVVLCWVVLLWLLLCYVVGLVGWLSFVSMVGWIWFALAGYNHTVVYRKCTILTCMLHWDTSAEPVGGAWKVVRKWGDARGSVRLG